MLTDRLVPSDTDLLVVLVAAPCIYLTVIAMTRIAGARSLATMTSFDFAATVAVGSTVASTATGTASLAVGVLVIVVLFALQYVVALLRRRGWTGGVFDNDPVLVVAHGRVLADQLDRVRLSRGELMGQLRLAGISALEEVTAAVLESNGEISVITTDRDLDPDVLAGIRGLDALRTGRED